MNMKERIGYLLSKYEHQGYQEQQSSIWKQTFIDDFETPQHLCV